MEKKQSGSKKGRGGRVTRDSNSNVEPAIYRKAMEQEVVAFKRRMGWINATRPNRNKGLRWVNSHQLNGGECQGESQPLTQQQRMSRWINSHQLNKRRY